VWAGAVFGALAAALLAAAAYGSPGDDAARILAAAEFKGGLIVHVGCGDGKLTAALHAGDACLVHGLDADAANVQAARAHIRSLGLYGPVSVEQWADAARLPYADNLVNLLVISDSGLQISEHKMPEAEVLRVLAPLGVAYVKGAEGKWTKTTKPWPKDIDEWTHYLHGPDNNAVAKDSVVGPPGRVQWVEGPLWLRHHELNSSVAALVSTKGRIFYICDESPATVSGVPDSWSLVARDAFNGLLLWKRPMRDWGWKAWSNREAGGRFNLPLHVARRLVAVGDRVYVTLGFNAPLTALDAATGKTVRTYAGTEFTDEVTCRDGLLVLSVNQAAQECGLISANPPVKKQILAVKADTGEVLWRQGDYAGIASKSDVFERITYVSLTVGPGQVFLVEEDAVVGLDLKTGRELWRAPRPPKTAAQGHVPYRPANLTTLVAHEDVVLFSQAEEPYTTKTWNRGVKTRLMGLSAATGQVLWNRECSKWGPGAEGDVFVIGGLVWTHAADDFALLGLDPHTGQVRRTVSSREAFDEVHHHRCYRDKATERYLLTGRRGIEFIGLQDQACRTHDWVRGACRFGIVPCNGLVYAPPHPCQCYIDVKVNGFFALAPDNPPKAPAPPKTPPAERLQAGPAYGQPVGPPSAVRNPPSQDWPTYRHDCLRSGATNAEVPTDLRSLWQTRVGGRLSACTAAGGKVFVASVDQHRVCALDAKDGQLCWDYTAGGRVDTPPTLHEGLVLFGAADGWVYCLRGSDGALAWRFRAGPEERRILAFGQLESPWPVHGTVLVKDSVAYVAAGRSTYLDGGIKVYAIEPQSGKLIRELEPLGSSPNGLEDVLVSDGTLVYMRQLAFSLQEGALKPPEKRAGPPASGPGTAGQAGQGARRPGGGLGCPRAFSTAGLLDDTYFSRVGWSTGDKAGKSDLLVFDERGAYGCRSQRTGGFGGWFEPATGAYRLEALDRNLAKPRWSQTMPIRVRAMTAAGSGLFLAGPPDVLDANDPLAAFQGRKGALLWAVSTADGKKVGQWTLDSEPVFDGLIAAAGRLYLSTCDGRVLCMGGQ
jgi:outer membrane protein assembly factor BamB